MSPSLMLAGDCDDVRTTANAQQNIIIFIIMPLPIGKGAINVVCPSIRLSVRYIANNSRTQRTSLPKLIWKKVPHLRCDSHTSFKVISQRSRSPGPLTHAHRAPYPVNGKAYGLKSWCKDGGRRLASATGAMTSKVKVARSRDQSEPSWTNAVPVSSETGGGISCRPNLAATLLVITPESEPAINQFFKIRSIIYVYITRISTSPAICCYTTLQKSKIHKCY